MRPALLAPGDPASAFPDPERVRATPSGLVALGGDLAPERLLYAYRHGIFPWYSAGQPILWWSPQPRCVLDPRRFHCSRSLRRTLRSGRFVVTVDRAFEAVITACARIPRPGQDETWITEEMRLAYLRLHRLGHAHSIECWNRGRLVGGLYGIAIGRVFFGESMFHRQPDASKVALHALTGRGFALIDCQLESPHLLRLGATCIPRHAFLAALDRWCEAPPPVPGWNLDAG